MSKKYRDKKGSACAMCKPHKRGWEDKESFKNRQLIISKETEIKEN